METTDTEARPKPKGNLKHSHCINGHRSKEHAAWTDAKQRCTNANQPEFHRYGGRGIKMCAEWMNDFSAFLAHIGPAAPGLSLDRIDNDRGYEPGNVRWATRAEQCATRKNSNQYIARREREALPLAA
jgi:hypothetical protein